MKCLMSRGLMTGWAGTHNPTYNQAQLDAATVPTSAWTAITSTGMCNGYVIGYGSVYMNQAADNSNSMGWLNYSDTSAMAKEALVTHLKLMLSICSDFSRGFSFLAIADTDTEDTSPRNTEKGAASWGQMLDYIVKNNINVIRTTTKELEGGSFHYSDDPTFYNQYRGVILMLQNNGDGAYKPTDRFLAVLNEAIRTGVPFIVLQRDGYNGRSTFNRLFNTLNLNQAGTSWVQFTSSALASYKSSLGDDASFTGLTELHSGVLFYSGAATYNQIDKGTVDLMGLEGQWGYSFCAVETVIEEPDVSAGVVKMDDCCFDNGSIYVNEFDVSVNVIKPEDWRSTVQSGALSFKWWGDWEPATRYANVMNIISVGLMSPEYGASVSKIITYRGKQYSGRRSYNILVLDKSNGDPLDYQSFDVFGNPNQGTACAAYLNAQDESKIVVIVTVDEPHRNMETTALEAALYRCGASRYALKFKMVYRSAYVLVGVPSQDIGRGIERIAGTIDSDPESTVKVNIDIRKNAAPVMEVVTDTIAGNPFIGELHSTNDNLVIDSNFVKYRNLTLRTDATTRGYIKNVLAQIALNKSSKNILLASDSFLTTRGWSFGSPDENTSFSYFIEYLGELGYIVDVHDIKTFPYAEPNWFTPYTAVVILFGDTTYSRRVEPYVNALMVAARRGVGVFAIGDNGLAANMNFLLRYYDITLRPVGTLTDTSVFDVDIQKVKHPLPTLLDNLTGYLQDDTVADGYFISNPGMIPVVIDNETLDLVGYKNLGRTATFRYTKQLERYDSLRMFAVRGYTQLTDVRFKKLPFFGSDDFYMNFGLPCVTQLDNPDIRIGDGTVQETDGVLLFDTLWIDKVTGVNMIPPSGATRTDYLIRTKPPFNWGSYLMTEHGVEVIPVGGNWSSAYEGWNMQITYRVYIDYFGVTLWRFSSDNGGSFYLDGVLIHSDGDAFRSYTQGSLELSPGWHNITVTYRNNYDGGGWSSNPSAVGLMMHPSFTNFDAVNNDNANVYDSTLLQSSEVDKISDKYCVSTGGAVERNCGIRFPHLDEALSAQAIQLTPAGDWSYKYWWMHVLYKFYVGSAQTVPYRVAFDGQGVFWLDGVEKYRATNQGDLHEGQVYLSEGWHTAHIADQNYYDGYSQGTRQMWIGLIIYGFDATADKASNAKVEVKLSEPVLNAEPIYVKYKTTPGSASIYDYTPRDSTLVFNSGEQTKTISIPITGDNIEENTELFYVDLEYSSRGTIVKSRGVVTLLDDDMPVFTTRQWDKVLDWGWSGFWPSNYVKGVDVLLVGIGPGSNAASVWTANAAGTPDGDSMTLWAHYKFYNPAAKTYKTVYGGDDSTNINVFPADANGTRTSNTAVFKHSHGGGSETGSGSLTLAEGWYRVECSNWNKSDGKFSGNPGWFGLKIYEV